MLFGEFVLLILLVYSVLQLVSLSFYLSFADFCVSFGEGGCSVVKVSDI